MQETKESLEAQMKGTLNKLFGSGISGCPCAECEAASFSFDNETFETIVRSLPCATAVGATLTLLIV